MHMNWQSLWRIASRTVDEFLVDRVMRLAAATAYYAIFSIGPLLVLTIGVAGLVFGEETVRKEVLSQISGFVGEKAASMINAMLSTPRQGGSFKATIIGSAALVIGGTGAFAQLQDSLNTIWGVTVKPGKSVGAFLRARFFSMAMVLAIGFVLLVSMALSTFIVAFSHYIGNLVALPGWLIPLFNDAINFVVITFLFALIFKVLPDVKVRWRDVWVGAAGTALLFTIGKFLLGFYLARATNTSAYGAGSAVVIILLYIYYASVILYFGAEFTKVCARQRGARFQPSNYAVRITNSERAEQGMPRPAQVQASIRREESGNLARFTPASPPRPMDQPWRFLGFAFAIGTVIGLAYRVRNTEDELKH